jgi:hypothetical protein
MRSGQISNFENVDINEKRKENLEQNSKANIMKNKKK